jgi:hypothetical protein
LARRKSPYGVLRAEAPRACWYTSSAGGFSLGLVRVALAEAAQAADAGAITPDASANAERGIPLGPPEFDLSEDVPGLAAGPAPSARQVLAERRGGASSSAGWPEAVAAEP